MLLLIYIYFLKFASEELKNNYDFLKEQSTKNEKVIDNTKVVKPKSDDSVDSEKREDEISSKVDKSTFSLYKKIPMNSDCSIDELVDGEHSLRDVMQGILKLEILKFVTMLPGDRVKRNL